MKTKYTDPKGIVWYPYCVDFESPDGKFSVDLWAISDDHAQLQIQALKETAKLAYRIESVIPAGK